jgi:RNA polymerase sigma-70 factor (ECF subfamily)
MDAVATKACPDTAWVIAQYRGMVYGIALSHTKNTSDADDVFQEVFLAYHRKQPLLESDERRKAWLITTTLNCVRQLTMGSWRRKVVPLHEQPVQEQTDDGFHFRTDEQDAVFSALQELSDRYRSVLYLFYFEDMSIAQIGRALDIETGTVKVRLSRGRAQMRDRLRDRLRGEYFDE